MKILSTAPCRLSLFGGGSDVPPYSTTYGGICINIAINIRSKFTLFTDDDMYDPQANSEIPYLGNKEFVHTFLREFGIGDMHLARFNSQTDGLLESGMGSSASSAVAIVGAVNKYKNLGMNREEIAEKAWDIEVNKLGLYGGKQDQYVSAFGGANIMEFKEKVTITPIDRKVIEPLIPHMVLFYTGSNRQSAKIQESFKKLSNEQIKILNQIKELAKLSIEPIKKGDIKEIGKMLDETWEYKKHSNEGVSNPRIDSIYIIAMRNGAIGFKCCGAGGGGFILCICPPEAQNQLKKALKENGCIWYDFGIDWTGLDVRILPE